MAPHPNDHGRKLTESQLDIWWSTLHSVPENILKTSTVVSRKPHVAQGNFLAREQALSAEPCVNVDSVPIANSFRMLVLTMTMTVRVITVIALITFVTLLNILRLITGFA